LALFLKNVEVGHSIFFVYTVYGKNQGEQSGRQKVKKLWIMIVVHVCTFVYTFVYMYMYVINTLHIHALKYTVRSMVDALAHHRPNDEDNNIYNTSTK
jgi:flagellar basal body-associated protein FliL